MPRRGPRREGPRDRQGRRHRPGRPLPRVLAQFLALALIWGSSFLFVAVGLEGLSPGQVVLGRVGAGALALLAVCAVRRHRLPTDPRADAHLLVVALLLCVAPFLLFAWAQQHISSGLASIDNATTMLMTTLVALAALPEERPTRTRLRPGRRLPRGAGRARPVARHR